MQPVTQANLDYLPSLYLSSIHQTVMPFQGYGIGYYNGFTSFMSFSEMPLADIYIAPSMGRVYAFGPDD